MSVLSFWIIPAEAVALGAAALGVLRELSRRADAQIAGLPRDERRSGGVVEVRRNLVTASSTEVLYSDRAVRSVDERDVTNVK